MQTIYWDLKNNERDKFMDQAARCIKDGQVVAFPTETVYGLGADGLNGPAVAKIFAAKGRPADNPLILHIADKKEFDRLAVDLSANAKALIDTFMPGPLTLIVKKSSLIPDEVTTGLPTVGIRMPSHPVAAELIRRSGCPIAAPSANLSGKPSPTNAHDVAEDMDGRIAGILDGGRCGIGVESTIVDTTTPIPTILRPGGVTREMLEHRLGAVEIDPALYGVQSVRPKAPGMKYRHYAPKAPMYLYEGPAAAAQLIKAVHRAMQEGHRIGVLCDQATAAQLPENADRCVIASWGMGKDDLAEHLYNLLRAFDHQDPEFILGLGVDEHGLGLATMNRMRKAAGFNILWATENEVSAKSGSNFPGSVLK
jgi:L-threonylcarbamoyladenylate synthase